MVLRSNLRSRFTVATIFWGVGTIPSTVIVMCCSRVSGTGANGTCVVGGEEGPAAAFGMSVTGAVVSSQIAGCFCRL